MHVVSSFPVTNHVSLHSRPFKKWKLWAEGGMARSSRENPQGGTGQRTVLKKEDQSLERIALWAMSAESNEVNPGTIHPNVSVLSVGVGPPVLQIHHDGKLHQSLT